ncbi:M81 family metallopeptidase [Aquicoccus sp. SU-CL01552]|uniref:M81 family metallopeptidase n=1 Tax=Aquicoccus sp. SU-CL01552 TaxID=3127656 RepID=UPI003108064C
MRIVFAGFQHETNTFAPDKADDAAFAHGGGFPGLCRGTDVFDALVPTANVPAAGFVKAARTAGHEIVPVLWCAACPSGPVAQETYERITTEIIDGIMAALPADAIYLDLHGAMVAEHVDDGEGALLSRLRAKVGDLPIVVSLDLHANVTARMLEAADALVAFRTYPHVDMAATGARALAVLESRLAVGKPFAMAARRLPFLLPICWQSTDDQPAKGLYERLESIEAETGVPALNFTMGFAAADFAECSPVVWAYGATEREAIAAAETMEAEVLAAEAAFEGPLFDAEGAVAEALALNAQGMAPIVIADAQDNPGAGGNSDTTGLLRALIAADVPDAAIGLIVDPAAVAAAHAAGEGATVHVALGGRTQPGDAPVELEAVVERLSDGNLRTKGPYYGENSMDLGPSACLRVGGVRIVIASHKAQLADQEMFRYVGIEPTRTKILVVKSAIHFRADFRPIAAKILTAVAPGPMAMLATDWTWTNLPDAMRMRPCGPTFAEVSGKASEPIC